MDAVVRALADKRLLTTGREEQAAERWVNVSHEALIRGWPELRKWLDEDREALRVLRRVTEATQEWERLGRDADALYRGARLAEAVEWRARDETSLNDLERAFLDASTALQARELSVEKARQLRNLEAAQRLAATEKERAEVAHALARTERTARLRQRYLSIGLAGLLLVASLVSVLAVLARNEAINQQAIASSRELAASAIARLSIDPELSLLLALEATSQAPTAEASDSLRQSVLASQVRVSLRGHTGAVHSAVFSPDGGRVVTASPDRTARIWEASTGREVVVLQGHTDEVVRAVFSADGERVLTAGLDKTARIWDARTGRPMATLQGHAGWVRRAVFSPDGTHVVTASSDETAAVWDASTGREVFVLRGHTQWPELGGVQSGRHAGIDL